MEKQNNNIEKNKTPSSSKCVVVSARMQRVCGCTLSQRTVTTVVAYADQAIANVLLVHTTYDTIFCSERAMHREWQGRARPCDAQGRARITDVSCDAQGRAGSDTNV